jgi:subtilisin family serine protease
MHKNIVFLLTLLFPEFLSAQKTIMPAQTLAAIEQLQESISPDRNAPSQEVIDLLPVYKEKGGLMISVMCRISDAFDPVMAEADGLIVGAMINHIATLRIPIHLLTKDFAYPGIEYLEVAEKIAPTLHEAIKDIRADLVHQGVDLPQPFTGKGVIIGVVDWGFDYTHPMFFDTSLSYTRILASWDQVKKTGTPPDGFDHGALYTGADELMAAQHDTVSPLTDYHGTHVAGIAGGSGGGTIYRGVGFESDFLFSQMRNDVSSAVEAFQWMYNVAQAQGKRLVINNSWGNYRLFPLDGTSLMSQAIEAFTDLGVVFVFSAGNNGDINFHLKKSFNSDSVRTRIMGFDYTNDKDLWGQSVGMWGEPGHAFSAQVRVLDASNQLLVKSDLWSTATATPYLDTFIVTGTDTIVIHATTDAAHPLNGRPQMTLDIRNKNAALKKILYIEADSGTVHCWNTRFTVYGIGNWGYGFTASTQGYVNGDKNYGIGHPAVTESVITTAAHETNFLLTGFSSYGPRMDELQKPDISAPGSQIVSSFNSFSASNFLPVTTTTFNGREYDFIRLSGTSMSAPMVTGVVALLLEAAPDLSAHEVKDIIIQGARTDPNTGNIPPQGHVRWGHGKLDAVNVLQLVLNTSVTTHGKAEYHIFPNPASEMVFTTKALQGDERYLLFDGGGKCVQRGQFKGYIALHELPSGIYTAQIMDALGTSTFRLLVTH